MVILIINNHRHAAAFEIKRKFIHQAAIGFNFQLFVFQNRPVNQISETCLKIAVKIGIIQNIFAGISQNIDMFLEDNAVLGKSASFISTEHIHRPKILDGWQTLDYDLFLSHG